MNKLYEVKTIVPNDIRQFLKQKECGVCNISAVMNESEELDIMYGSVVVNDRGKYSNLKGFDTMFPWHFWNVDKDNNIYDDMSNLLDGIEVNRFDCKPPSQWKLKLVDGSTYDCMENGKVSMVKVDKLRKQFDKWFKGYDAVYIYNFAFIPDLDTSYKGQGGIPYTRYEKQMNWDDAEFALQHAENLLKSYYLINQ